MPIKVLIVGAGIAGLATAIALGKQGHEVEIFEKSAFSSEIGAAFHFSPNGCRVLQAWGVDLESMRPCICKRWRHLDSDDLVETSVKFDLEQKRRSLGITEDEIMIHRIDAHSVLHKHALSMPNVKLHLGSGIQSVCPGDGLITLKSGSVHRGDVVVGADGVHSKAIEAIDMPASKTYSMGINMYRFMVQTSKARSDPIVKSFLDNIDFPDTHNSIINSQTRHTLVIYSCRGGELINCATFQHAAAEKVKLTDDFTNPGTVEEVLDLMETWPDPFKALAKLAEDVKHWAVIGRDVPKSYVKARLVLVGDAAHPTQPTHGAGANMGIEDGAVLGTLLDANTNSDNLAQRLDLYNKARYPRTVIVKFGSEMLKLFADSREEAERLLQDKVPGAALPQDMEGYLWSFDAIQNAKDMLAAAS